MKGRCRSDVGPTSERRRSDVGPMSERLRADVGPTSLRRRSDVAPTSLRHPAVPWSCTYLCRHLVPHQISHLMFPCMYVLPQPLHSGIPPLLCVFLCLCLQVISVSLVPLVVLYASPSTATCHGLVFSHPFPSKFITPSTPCTTVSLSPLSHPAFALLSSTH